ncbi:hypothetical protein E2320_001319 [Naja naja]|nr:hypothetical protein E2320_001319 [Naja naja]
MAPHWARQGGLGQMQPRARMTRREAIYRWPLPDLQRQLPGAPTPWN